MITAIIQARMGSTRLPGKTMKIIDGKNPLLFFVIDQLKHCRFLDEIIVATTDLAEDDIIEKYVSDLKLNCFRGNAKDVLDRYYQCAKKFACEDIVRITADCPLIDPLIVDQVIQEYKSGHYDYTTNTLIRTFPYGTDVEVFSFDILKIAWMKAKSPSEREHVTPYIRNNKKLFRVRNITYKNNISDLRWTVDRIEDFNLVKTIISEINKSPILIEDILNFHSKNPKVFDLDKNHQPNKDYLLPLKKDEKI